MAKNLYYKLSNNLLLEPVQNFIKEIHAKDGDPSLVAFFEGKHGVMGSINLEASQDILDGFFKDILAINKKFGKVLLWSKGRDQLLVDNKDFSLNHLALVKTQKELNKESSWLDTSALGFSLHSDYNIKTGNRYFALEALAELGVPKKINYELAENGFVLTSYGFAGPLNVKTSSFLSQLPGVTRGIVDDAYIYMSTRNALRSSNKAMKLPSEADLPAVTDTENISAIGAVPFCTISNTKIDSKKEWSEWLSVQGPKYIQENLLSGIVESALKQIPYDQKFALKSHAKFPLDGVPYKDVLEKVFYDPNTFVQLVETEQGEHGCFVSVYKDGNERTQPIAPEAARYYLSMQRELAILVKESRMELLSFEGSSTSTSVKAIQEHIESLELQIDFIAKNLWGTNEVFKLSEKEIEFNKPGVNGTRITEKGNKVQFRDFPGFEFVIHPIASKKGESHLKVSEYTSGIKVYAANSSFDKTDQVIKNALEYIKKNCPTVDILQDFIDRQTILNGPGQKELLKTVNKGVDGQEEISPEDPIEPVLKEKPVSKERTPVVQTIDDTKENVKIEETKSTTPTIKKFLTIDQIEPNTVNYIKDGEINMRRTLLQRNIPQDPAQMLELLEKKRKRVLKDLGSSELNYEKAIGAVEPNEKTITNFQANLTDTKGRLLVIEQAIEENDELLEEKLAMTP